MEKLENQCLKLYNNKEEFIRTVDQLKIESWIIYDAPIAERMQNVKYKIYYQQLRKKNIKTQTGASDEEIISWIDTMSFLYNVFKKIDDNIDFQIIQELKIPYSNKRPDYIITKDNKILILEFSFRLLSEEYQYENKLTQAIGYKELLSNLLPDHIQIATYTLLINPEIRIQMNGLSIIENGQQDARIQKSYDDIKEYINNFFKTTKKTALEEINSIIK